MVAEQSLAGDRNQGTTGDRYQVIVHVDAATLQSEEGVTDLGQAAVEVGGRRHVRFRGNGAADRV